MPKFYTRFDPPPNPVYKSDLPSAVHPEFGYEADINNLVENRVNSRGVCQTFLTGISSSLPPNPDSPKYGDFSQYTSDKLSESMNIIARARSQFEMLPSSLRARFSNDPRHLVDFVSDDSNYYEALKLGLVAKKKSLTPDEKHSISTDAKVTGSKPPEA